MKFSKTLPLLFCCGFALDNHANDEENQSDLEMFGIYGEEDFISIATGIAQPIAKAPAVASVITDDDIRNIGAIDLDEVLETVPGLHVSRDFAGYNPLYTFRGISADLNPQVLVLINGIPITNLFHGDRNLVWGGMPVEAISRLEIIRGPGSALYGADAFAGVINIVTKSPSELQGVSVGGRAGSYNSKDLWLTAGGSVGGFEMSAVLEFHKTDGQDEKVDFDAQSLLDLIAGTTVSNAPGQVNLSRENIDARFEIRKGNIKFRGGAQIRNDFGDGVGAAQVLNESNKFESNRYNFDITYQNSSWFENTSMDFQVSYFETTQEVDGNYEIFPQGSTGPFLNPFGVPIFPPFPEGVIGNPEVFESHYRAGFTAKYSGLNKHEISFGAGYYYGEIDKVTEEKNFGINPNTLLPILPGDPLVDVSDTSFVFLTEDDRENYYAYLQDVWQLANDWELTAGVRFDDYSDFGNTTNPRLALVWSTTYKLTTKLLYGEAFRAPSFAQTRAINNPVVLGNIDLEPEEIKSYEIAFDYRPNYDLTFNLNMFYYDWSDIIQFVPDPGGSTRTAQNAGEQTGYGLEFEAAWSATDNLQLTGNFSWQKSTDETMDTDAANSPEKQLYLRADWSLPEEWKINMQANWVMDRNRVVGDLRPDIDDYVLVDLTVRKNISKNLEVAVIARNLFDEDAREPSPNGSPVPFIPNDLPLAGRSVLGEIRFSF